MTYEPVRIYRGYRIYMALAANQKFNYKALSGHNENLEDISKYEFSSLPDLIDFIDTIITNNFKFTLTNFKITHAG